MHAATLTRYVPALKKRFPTEARSILLGALAVTLAALVRLALESLVRNHGPFLFFAIGVVIAALYGGFRAGITATILSIPVCDYLFIEPRYTWFIHDARGDSVMLFLFATLGLITTAIIHRFQKTRRALVESDAKLAMVADAVPEILFTATGEGSAEYLNAHFSDYSGRELPALLGTEWLDIIHPDDRPKFLSELSKRIEMREEFRTLIRLRRSAGVYRWFKCHARPVLDSSGKLTKWFGVISDIDEEKNRTQELAHLNKRLERFAYAASHDLQNRCVPSRRSQSCF